MNHDQLPADTNRVVSELFFALVEQYLEGHVSIVIEAAFQHHGWEAQVPAIRTLSHPVLVLCDISAEVAAQRYHARAQSHPDWTFYHGSAAPSETYIPPQLHIPTFRVTTDRDPVAVLEELVQYLHADTTPIGFFGDRF